MINLIRNELTKIFSKKAIYVYSIVIFGMLIFMSVYARSLKNNNDVGLSNEYIELLEDNLDTFDLTDEQQLKLYVEDRVTIDSNKLSSKYSFESPEYFYVTEVIEPLILEKYNKEYIEKNTDDVKEVQSKIDEEVKRLNNFDWKYQLLRDKEEVNGNIKNLNDLYSEDKDNEEYKMLLETLNIELWCINYRLDNKIPYAHNAKSNLVDNYHDYSIQYLSAIKDESLIKDKKELIENREIISNYEVTKYKLDNKLIENDQEMIEWITISMAYIDGLIVIAIIILSGSIVSEEFNKGTIKQLLTKPFTRGKILTSKIIASLIAICLFVLLYEIVFILANCYEYNNFTGVFSTNVVYDFDLGKVREVSVLGQSLYGFLSVTPAYLIIFAIILFVGALSTSSVASMCAGFGVFLFYDLLNGWLSPKVLSFVPFYTWDLTPYMYGGMSSNIYASFGKSFIIDVITLVLFIVMTYIVFKRKDIKNQ